MKYIEEAKELINSFCKFEYGESADFEDLCKIPIAHTDYEQDDTLTINYISIDVYANLFNYSIEYYVNGKWHSRDTYGTKEKYLQALEYLDYNALVLLPDEFLKEV